MTFPCSSYQTEHTQIDTIAIPCVMVSILSHDLPYIIILLYDLPFLVFYLMTYRSLVFYHTTHHLFLLYHDFLCRPISILSHDLITTW